MPLNSSSDIDANGAPNLIPDSMSSQHSRQAPRTFPQSQPQTQTRLPNPAPPLRSQGEFYMTGVIPVDPSASLLPLDAECTICLERLTTDIVEMQVCHHYFHTICILSWLENNAPRNGTKRGNCPNCRRDFYEPDPRPERSYTFYSPLRVPNVMAEQEGVIERQEQVGAVPANTHADVGERRLPLTRANILNQFRMRREAGAAPLERDSGGEAVLGRPAVLQSNDRAFSCLPPPPAERTPHNIERRNAMVPGQYPSVGSDQNPVAPMEARLAMMLARHDRRRPDVTPQYHIPTGAPHAPYESAPRGYLAVRQEFEQLLERSGLTAERLLAVWRRQRPLINDAPPVGHAASEQVQGSGQDSMARVLNPDTSQRIAASRPPFVYEVETTPSILPAPAVHSDLSDAQDRFGRLLSRRGVNR